MPSSETSAMQVTGFLLFTLNPDTGKFDSGRFVGLFGSAATHPSVDSPTPNVSVRTVHGRALVDELHAGYPYYFKVTDASGSHCSHISIVWRHCMEAQMHMHKNSWWHFASDFVPVRYDQYHGTRPTDHPAGSGVGTGSRGRAGPFRPEFFECHDPHPGRGPKGR